MLRPSVELAKPAFGQGKTAFYLRGVTITSKRHNLARLGIWAKLTAAWYPRP